MLFSFQRSKKFLQMQELSQSKNLLRKRHKLTCFPSTVNLKISQSNVFCQALLFLLNNEAKTYMRESSLSTKNKDFFLFLCIFSGMLNGYSGLSACCSD